MRPEGISVDYGYDKASRLITYRDARSHTTRWGYDALNRKRTTTYPDTTTETIFYDAALERWDARICLIEADRERDTVEDGPSAVGLRRPTELEDEV